MDLNTSPAINTPRTAEPTENPCASASLPNVSLGVKSSPVPMNAANNPKPLMRITLLGTGSPEASMRRASSGYLLEINSDVILLDCGGGVFDRLLQAGHKPSDVTHLFFSHLHSDHMMDYARLMHAAWDESGQTPKVFGPAPIRSITEKPFGKDGVFATDLIARTENAGSQEVWLARGGTLPRPWPKPEIVEIEAGFEFNSNNSWNLSSCEVWHAQPQLHCMAFRIDANNKSFVYSGDAALGEDLENLANGCDVLLHWCYRELNDQSLPSVAKLSPDTAQIAQLAERCSAKQLILTHLRNHMDSEESHVAMKNAIRKNYSRSFSIAEDLTQINI